MVLSKDITETIENIKNNVLELDKDKRIDVLKEDLSNVALNALDKAANYVIKAMPIPDAMKDVLKDIKLAMKTKDLKGVITTAVNSSVREGLEILGLSKSTIKDLKDIKKLADKGGFITLLKSGVDIVAKNYLKNNLVSDFVYKFVDKLKEYILSKDFMNKLNTLVEKLTKKKDDFLNKCEEWYKSYKNMDISSINSIAEELAKDKYAINRYEDCKKENSIIQNMTAMVNNKKGFLSDTQQRLCEVI